MNRRPLLLAPFAFSLARQARSADAAALLTVSGKIKRSNGPSNSFSFSEEAFQALEQSTIFTSTFWTPKAKFEGPKLSTVMSYVGATGTSLRCYALDDYNVLLPFDDLSRFQPIVAHSMDGQRLQRARFGPLWVIYPRDQFRSELDGSIGGGKFIWQLRRIVVE